MTRDETKRWRIVVADRHGLVRRGLSALIDEQPDLQVCAACATRRATLAAIAATRAHLLMTGLSLADGDGLVLLGDVRAQRPDLPVLVLSGRDPSRWAEQALLAGATGYVSKQERGEALLAAIRSTLRTERHTSAAAAAKKYRAQPT